MAMEGKEGKLPTNYLVECLLGGNDCGNGRERR